MSQPTDVPHWESVPNFVFQEESGQGVFIYHVEFGIDTDNDVSYSVLYDLNQALTITILGFKGSGDFYHIL
jgi:hypothetical protein